MDAILVLLLLVSLGVGLLYLIATGKIITKAGYSGWWILVPLTPIALWLITLVALASATYSPFNSVTSAYFNASGYAALFVFDGIAALLPWVFFLIFAFSDWPVHQRLREQSLHLGPTAVTAVPQALSPPLQSAPRVAPAPTPSSQATPDYSDLHQTSATRTCRLCDEPAPIEAEFCGACGAPVQIGATQGTKEP